MYVVSLAVAYYLNLSTLYSHRPRLYVGVTDVVSSVESPRGRYAPSMRLGDEEGSSVPASTGGVVTPAMAEMLLQLDSHTAVMGRMMRQCAEDIVAVPSMTERLDAGKVVISRADVVQSAAVMLTNSNLADIPGAEEAATALRSISSIAEEGEGPLSGDELRAMADHYAACREECRKVFEALPGARQNDDADDAVLRLRGGFSATLAVHSSPCPHAQSRVRVAQAVGMGTDAFLTRAFGCIAGLVADMAAPAGVGDGSSGAWTNKRLDSTPPLPPELERFQATNPMEPTTPSRDTTTTTAAASAASATATVESATSSGLDALAAFVPLASTDPADAPTEGLIHRLTHLAATFSDIAGGRHLPRTLSEERSEWEEATTAWHTTAAVDATRTTATAIDRTPLDTMLVAASVNLPPTGLEGIVRTAPSTIDGTGVFAVRDIARGEIVTLYRSDVVMLPADSLDEAPPPPLLTERRWAPDGSDYSARGSEAALAACREQSYALNVRIGGLEAKITPDLDLPDRPDALGHLINAVTTRSELSAEDARRVNARLCTIFGGAVACVVAARDIRAGEELLTYYGGRYKW